ncbi:hypothetical protein DSO57_1021695 [Entomophthora muscae]|uniref:Uncharacterized protein n=1 Tax=Entomophthora muscae TaxID=34485 RepID=A0ACC2SS66_9FUNG|nr:hypothetical protein DSO57_1021695 [Entomophthora muscae]
MLFWFTQLLPYFVFAIYQFSTRSPGPPALPPAVFCSPGVSFGPVYFINYPLKPQYKDYTLEKIIKLDPLARIQSAVRYNCQGLKIFSAPKLFRGKFNYLPAYNFPMKLPVTLKPLPASSPDLPTKHTGKLFGIVYIILTGVIDTIILAAGLWSWMGKLWALPAKNPAQVTPENDRLAAQDWIPDTDTIQYVKNRPQKVQETSQTNIMGRIHRIKVPTELKKHNKNLLSKKTTAINKQIHAITPQKPAITKPLPVINMQMPTASQPVYVPSCTPAASHLATPCPPMPAGQSPFTP